MLYDAFISSQQLFTVFYIKLFVHTYIYLMVLDLRLGLSDLSHMSEYYNSRRLFCHRCRLRVC